MKQVERARRFIRCVLEKARRHGGRMFIVESHALEEQPCSLLMMLVGDCLCCTKHEQLVEDAFHRTITKIVATPRGWPTPKPGAATLALLKPCEMTAQKGRIISYCTGKEIVAAHEQYQNRRPGRELIEPKWFATWAATVAQEPEAFRLVMAIYEIPHFRFEVCLGCGREHILTRENW